MDERKQESEIPLTIDIFHERHRSLEVTNKRSQRQTKQAHGKNTQNHSCASI